MRNERGSTLVLVLLVSVVLLTVGLTIFSLTIGGTKRTDIRKQDVVSTQGSIETMNRAISDFKQAVQELPDSLTSDLQDSLNTGSYERKLGDIRSKIEQDYTSEDGTVVLTITDTSKERLDFSLVNYTTEYLTRAYEFVLQYANEDMTGAAFTKVVTRNVYISPTPSFLQYAVGSEEDLYLNGASDIVGNVYANTMYVGNVAKYVNELLTNTAARTYSKAQTLYPAIRGEVVLDKELQALDNEIEKKTFDKNTLSVQKRQSFADYFYTDDTDIKQPPTVRKAYDPFVSVDFPKTFADKLNQLDLDNQNLELTKEDTQAANFAADTTEKIREKVNGPTLEGGVNSFNSSGHSVYLVEKQVNPGDLAKDFTIGSYAAKKVILVTDLPGTSVAATNDAFIINSDLKLTKDQWLVVNGDLEIYSNGKSISIEGNILVMGNITIHGNALNLGNEQDNISFYSSVYTTGKATIYSTNITGIDNKQLVLLAQDDLLITRINEFQKTTNTSILPMEAFFYTDKNAELYGVGSLFKVHGGIFAKGELTINAIRQDIMATPSISSATAPITLSISARELQQGNASRFVVEYDQSVILDQLEALPQVNALQVFMDDYTIDNTKKNDAAN